MGFAGCRRILVLGSGGAGKSTFARALAERLDLPLIHLDRHYWSAGWKPMPEDQWQQRVRSLASHEAWVMDGNFSATLPARIARCDAIIFLDLPRWACLWGVAARWLRHRGRSRPDLAEGCPEKLELEFLRWVWAFPGRSRPHVLAALETAPASVCVARLVRRSQVRAVLTALDAELRSTPDVAPTATG